MEKYRIGNLVYNMADIIDVTLPGQHQDLYGQAISYNILANHLLSCRPCNHGHGTIKESNMDHAENKDLPIARHQPACTSIVLFVNKSLSKIIIGSGHDCFQFTTIIVMM